MSDSHSKNQLARDFGIFLQPGFLLALLLLFGLCAIIAAALLWGNMKYGIPPF